MAARVAGSVDTAYQNYSVPANAFTQVNLTPHTSEGTTSYDNAELVTAMESIYHVAQQRVSYLEPLIPNIQDIASMFVTKDSFGKVQFTVKSAEGPQTPLFVPSAGTRAHSVTLLHTAFQIDQDVDKGMRRYKLMPEVQQEVANAMGRAKDIGILTALTGSVLKYNTVSDAAFKGIRTQSISAFPRSQIYAHGAKAAANSVSITWKKPDVELFDNLIESFEDDSIDVENLLIIGSPRLRRQLKKIDNFRDNEVTIRYGGNENARMIMWLGLKFVFMGPETLPKKSTVVGKKVGTAEGKLPAIAGASDLAIGANDDVHTFIVADLSGFVWGNATFAREASSSVRDDLSYLPQFYMKFGFGGMRMDDLKVCIVVCSNSRK